MHLEASVCMFVGQGHRSRYNFPIAEEWSTMVLGFAKYSKKSYKNTNQVHS